MIGAGHVVGFVGGSGRFVMVFSFRVIVFLKTKPQISKARKYPRDAMARAPHRLKPPARTQEGMGISHLTD
jgi:hypothetical protein